MTPERTFYDANSLPCQQNDKRASQGATCHSKVAGHGGYHRPVLGLYARNFDN